MIYIVEGIDRVGKSILCKALSESFRAVLFKDSFYDHENMNAACGVEKLQTTLNMLVPLSRRGVHVVLDRFHLTEAVYGKMRGYSTTDILSFEREVQGLLGKNVCLTLVNPVSIAKSSIEHGSSLALHDELFKKMFDVSCIEQKHSITYPEIDEYIASLIQAKQRGASFL